MIPSVFLFFGRSSSLTSQSFVHRGEEFENQVIQQLEKDLFISGVQSPSGKDGGIDFIGFWKFPQNPVTVVGQCKFQEKPVGISALREFCNVLDTVQTENRLVGIFCSSSGYTIPCKSFVSSIHSNAKNSGVHWKMTFQTGITTKSTVHHPLLLLTMNYQAQIMDFDWNRAFESVFHPHSISCGRTLDKQTQSNVQLLIDCETIHNFFQSHSHNVEL